MVKKIYRAIDIYFLLLIVALFSVYTYLHLFPTPGDLGEYILVFMLFALIVLGYFTGILISLVASAGIVFIFGGLSIYLSFTRGLDLGAGYFWIIIYPVCGLLSGLLGDKILLLVDKCKDLEARAESHLSYDEDTGFASSQALHQYLTKILSSAKRHGTDISMIAIQIKYHKGLRAKHGKERYGRILRSFSNVIHQELRVEDNPFRLEENLFLIVLENTDSVGARIVRSRIKDRLKTPLQIEEKKGEANVKINVRMSTVTYDRDKDMDQNALIDLAVKELEYDVE